MTLPDPFVFLQVMGNVIFITLVMSAIVRIWLKRRAIRSTVENLVAQAARTGSKEDIEKLLASLPLSYAVFYNLKRSDAASGALKSSQLVIPFYDIPGLTNVIPFFTSTKKNAQLKRPYAAMTWQNALEKVINTPSANGLTIGNSTGGWVGIDKQKARQVLGVRATRERELARVMKHYE